MADDINNFVRVRCDITGKDTILTWSGKVHAMQNDERTKLLFNVVGFNVARFDVETSTILSKEVMVYKDPLSGEILGPRDEVDATQSWLNPISGQHDRVIHVWNDPVCIPLRGGVKPQKLGDRLVWTMHIPLKYPLPDGTMYVANEIFHYQSNEEDMQLDCVPATVSWVRTGPLLPWMSRIADDGVTLLYDCVGCKVGSVEDIPDQLREYIHAMDRDNYLHTPKHITPLHANMTSWKYFNKLMQ